jgi:hypothetical protein
MDFKARFAATGKARLSVRVTVEEAGQVCVEFEGTYVALR